MIATAFRTGIALVFSVLFIGTATAQTVDLAGLKRQLAGLERDLRNMDTAIAIRTLLVKDGQIFLRSGAGIVADSDPQAEFDETVDKARALIQAIDMAREGTD